MNLQNTHRVYTTFRVRVGVRVRVRHNVYKSSY